MIKCLTEGPKALAKSSMCSETTIAVPNADLNNVFTYILGALGATSTPAFLLAQKHYSL